MRYYLDTNILAFVLFDKGLNENCDINVCDLLLDYENIFYISSIAMRELVSLYNDGRVKSNKYKTQDDLFRIIDELNYEIKPFTRGHVICYGNILPDANHKDPNDHMIIAQAISDKIPVITSDKKFKLYENQGLKLVLNKR
jgi:PIN domain nuclease of toxin-antitoxin system